MDILEREPAPLGTLEGLVTRAAEVKGVRREKRRTRMEMRMAKGGNSLKTQDRIMAVSCCEICIKDSDCREKRRGTL